MAARSIAALNLSFGMVSIPVRLFSATESSSSVRFNMLTKDGSRVKQQYVSEKDQTVVARADMVKGYEFEKDRFVLFAPEELKALEDGSSHVIEIVAFVPDKSVDPLYYAKAYLLAPDKRGGKPYALLNEAMRSSGKSALAKWAWKTKQYVVQVRPTDEGLVLQQLLYADEVRGFKDLAIETVSVSPPELHLALQLIEQIFEPTYDPKKFHDQEKQRVLAAIDKKMAGQEIVASAHAEDAPAAGQVIDLMAALQASLDRRPAPAPAAPCCPCQDRSHQARHNRHGVAGTKDAKVSKKGCRAGNRHGAADPGPSQEVSNSASGAPLHSQVHTGDARPVSNHHHWPDRRRVRGSRARSPRRTPLLVPGPDAASQSVRTAAGKHPAAKNSPFFGEASSPCLSIASRLCLACEVAEQAPTRACRLRVCNLPPAPVRPSLPWT